MIFSGIKIRTIVVLLALAVNFSFILGAESKYFIRGVVRDSISDAPVQFAFVSADKAQARTMTDKDGIFELTVPDNTRQLTVNCQGFKTKTVPVNKNRVNIYAIYLQPSSVELDEVVIKKTRYSKKNNPAVDLMQHIRKTASQNDPRRNPFYNYKTYQKISLALNNINTESRKGIVQKFPFLTEHLDTSQISGKPILPISIREQSTDVYFRRSPKGKHVVVTGKRSEGIDEMLDKESMDVFFNDVMGPVDIYNHDIEILQNRFVSPLSPIAADFYKFYLTDSITDSDGQKFYVLSFYPHNKTSFGFNGSLEVSANDTTAFVRRVSMKVPSEINLNFVENLFIEQQFIQAPDGSRLPVRDEMIVEAVLIPGTQGLYSSRIIDYSDHNFDRPENEVQIFRTKTPVSTHEKASERDSIFWTIVNPYGLSNGESKVGQMLVRLRKNKVFYWGEKIVRMLVTGYVPLHGENSKFLYGPMNTTISANPLEGARFRAGGITTAHLSPHFFARLYGAYGTRDHKWKYGLELEYSFNRKKQHSREFPVHSLRFNSTYDVDRPGQKYLFTNPDNVFLSLHRPGVDPMTYHRVNSLLYTLELETHFSVTAKLQNERQYSSRLMPFVLSGETPTVLNQFDISSAEIELRFAPGEKFYQNTSNRYPINIDRPVVALSHTFAPSGMGNFGSVNATQISYRQRFWFSAFGYLDVLLKGGHVWSRRTPFNHLFVANTNLSYTIQPESFALTAPLEFVADSYANAELTYWANGAILNNIPLLKRLRLREAFSVQAFYGHLSQGNDPASTQGLLIWPGCMTLAQRLRTPYMEASVGIDNIFRCLRVDYVWRLTHRNLPVSGGSRGGVRIAFHVTF